MKKYQLENIKIKELAQELREGQVLVVPSETCYGLSSDAKNSKAIKKIYAIKGREFNKLLLLLCSSLTQAKKYFLFSKEELELVKKYWPGALTIVLRVKKNPGLFLQKGQVDFAVRVPTDGFSRKLVRQFGSPMVSTSANVSDGENCYSADDVLLQFKDKKNQPDVLVDAGKLKRNKPSTIVKVNEKGEVEVLRQGEVSI